MWNLLRKGRQPTLVVLFLAAASLGAQESGPTLVVQTATGRTNFHIGERIPLKLTFTSPNDSQFTIAAWGCERGGEGCFETFKVSPSTGWSDPLAVYFAQGLPSFGHRWQPRPFLNSKPVQVLLDLNQWVRFNQPGVYTVKVTSGRVTGFVRDWTRPSFPLTGAVELHIVPATPDWQSATLATILEQLKPGGSSAVAAAADLRYLATPAAIDVMTDQLREGNAFPAWECNMGLLGLPDSMRNLAIAAMNKRIVEPDFPVSALFFKTMSLLHVASGSNAASIRQQREAYDPVFWQRVFAEVPKKEGASRAQTLQTLLRFGQSTRLPDVKSQMGALLRASFLDLDARSQVDDLRQHWDLLRSPGFLPTLQTLAKLPSINDDDLGAYSRGNLKSAAFRRWYELDPAGARSEMLAEIGSTNPSLSAQAVSFLPDEPLPQFEPLWADAFVKTTDQRQEKMLGSLLVRYGSGAATSQMIAEANEPARPYSCMPHALALAYLVRFSAVDARAILNRVVAKGEGEVGCDGDLLSLVSQGATGPPLNEAAVEMLNDSNPQTVVDAIQYLTFYGTKSDEKPLWDRYIQWSEKWSGKADLLDQPYPQPFDVEWGLREGSNLAEALISNQGWLASPASISRVLRLCVGKMMCKSFENDVRLATPPYQVNLPNASDPLGLDFKPSYKVAQYRVMSRQLLELKIRQYPPGTKFVLVSAWPDTEDQRKLEDETEGLFKEWGLLLERPAK